MTPTELVTEIATELETVVSTPLAEAAPLVEKAADYGFFNGIVHDLTSINIFLFILAAIAGYLIGSLNLAIVMSRGMGKDIREMGSGNAGTTNALRTMGKGAAAMVLVFDILKGSIIPIVLRLFADSIYYSSGNYLLANALLTMAYIYALFAVIGHCYPLYYKFKGGKGIATAAGALLVISTPATLMALVEFIIIVLLFRYVSLASIVAVINIPLFTYFTAPGEMRLMTVTILIALLALFKHRSNVVRLREGTESPLFGKKKDK